MDCAYRDECKCAEITALRVRNELDQEGCYWNGNWLIEGDKKYLLVFLVGTPVNQEVLKFFTRETGAVEDTLFFPLADCKPTWENFLKMQELGIVK